MNFRFLTSVSLATMASLSLAGEGDSSKELTGILGTKASSTQAFTPTTSSGGGLLQMVFAVLIVFVLMKWLLPKLISKYGTKISTGLNSSIKLEESASFPGGTLQVVTVRDRVLLLGVSGSNISTLADLGSITKNDPGPTFSEYLEVSPGEAPIDQTMIQMRPTPEEAQAALDRLQKLMS
jgi:flagellar biogenesis protein FliO